MFVQASGLARHARGLEIGASAGVLTHGAETPDGNPLQTPRLTVQATVTMLARGSEAFEAARAIFSERRPGAGLTRRPGDLSL